MRFRHLLLAFVLIITPPAFAATQSEFFHAIGTSGFSSTALTRPSPCRMMGLCLTASTKPTGNEPYRTLSGYAVGFFRVRLDPRPPLPYDGRMLTGTNLISIMPRRLPVSTAGLFFLEY